MRNFHYLPTLYVFYSGAAFFSSSRFTLAQFNMTDSIFRGRIWPRFYRHMPHHCPLTRFTPIPFCLNFNLLSRLIFSCPIISWPYSGPVPLCLYMPLCPGIPLSPDTFYPDPSLPRFHRLKPLNVSLSHSAHLVMPGPVLLWPGTIMALYASVP